MIREWVEVAQPESTLSPKPDAPCGSQLSPDIDPKEAFQVMGRTPK